MTISEKMTLFKREENDERSEWRLKAAFSGVVILVGGVLLTLVIYNINNVKWPDLNMGEGITQQLRCLNPWSRNGWYKRS